MNIVDEKVKHINFGNGIVTEVRDNTIWIKFQDAIGTKGFVYPDAFESFLKSESLALEKDALEELRIKKEKVESVRLEKEIIASEIKRQQEELNSLKKAKAAKSKKVK